MNIKKWILILSVFLLAIGCGDHISGGEQPVDPDKFEAGAGIFILNEGTFGSGNGSVSFYDKEKMEIQNDIFFAANARPIGDIPLSMTINNQKAYIVVNNSSKIEVVDIKNDFESVNTITDGINSPRYVCFLDNDDFVVSSLYSADISFYNSGDYSFDSYLNIGKSSENIVRVGDKLFVASWSEYFVQKPNNTIQVVDLNSMQLLDSIQIPKEPNSMVIDKNNKIWVLSSGGYLGNEKPGLCRINSITLSVELELLFDDMSSSPSSLCIDAEGDDLYFVNTDIYRLSITDSTLPSNVFIDAGERNIYKMYVDKEQNEVYFSDALDYNQKGMVYRYSENGIQIDSFSCGIIPSCFVTY